MKKTKTIVTVVILMLFAAVHIMRLTAYASEEGQTVQVSSWEELKTAIDQANEGDVIEIMDVITVPKYEQVVPAGRITLKKGSEQGKLVTENQSDVSFKNRFENIDFDGNSISSDSAFLELYGSASIVNCSFRNCITSQSAVLILYGQTQFDTCTFENNKGSNGGHVCIQYDLQIDFYNCTMTGGVASNNGGAICLNMESGILNVDDCTITGNEALNGGGIYTNKGFINITGSKIYGNTADKGADIVTYSTDFNIEQDLENLQSIYGDADFTVNGWITEQGDDGAVLMTLDYTKPTEETEEPEEPEEPSKEPEQTTKEPSKELEEIPTKEPAVNQEPISDKKTTETVSGNTSAPATPSTTSNSTTTNNSSTTNNYNQIPVTPQESKVVQSASTEQGQIRPNSQEKTSDEEVTTKDEKKAKTDTEEGVNGILEEKEPLADNISIDAKGVDVNFEVKDGVYSISINVDQEEQVTSESISGPSIDWYEVIEIVLLVILVINLTWNNRKRRTASE